MPRFDKILIANRGEIAVRVIRAARAMGLRTAAVFSEADRRAPHVRMADEAIGIGPAPSRDSYLSTPRLLEAARRAGAQAIHPGYGFLSENAAFARACAEAGLVFIGPAPETIERMGSKIEAKKIMEAGGVPVVPGYNGDDQREDVLAAEARRIGWPVLIKASAGGGGKGMRVARSDADLRPALEAARREAQHAFGDGTLLLEKYFDSARHIEFQIFGDTQGNLIHLFERECSIQRRHQKIIEESPSPFLTPPLRARMGEAAVAAGKAIGYVGAGTVEFLVDPDRRFYFLEVNTRLQVEHPVTEMVTRLDLVRLQIEVAQGRPLPLSQGDVAFQGQAMECRLYAEDPANRFYPSTGTIRLWSAGRAEGVRWDAGVESGSEVSAHYDPMIAKAIVQAPDRETASQRMIHALEELACLGVTTNREFLLDILRHPEFAAGRFDTHFIDRHFPDDARRRRPLDETGRRQLACAAMLCEWAAPRDPIGGFSTLPSGWRNNPYRPQLREYELEGRPLRIEYRALEVWNDPRRRFEVFFDGERHDLEGVEADPNGLIVELDGHRRSFACARDGEAIHLHSAGLGTHTLRHIHRLPETETPEAHSGTRAPMPGTVRRILVGIGESVKTGQAVVVMESMKMEMTLRAAQEGHVEAIHVAEGQFVVAETVLVTLGTSAAPIP